MAAEVLTSRQARSGIEALSAEDFETASIRSAAPSYISDAPSYHSTGPHADPTPPYSPPAPGSTLSGAAGQSSAPRVTPAPNSARPRPAGSTNPTSTPTERRYGLPPVPTGPPRSELPSLGAFQIPSWSNVRSNPTARHYHNVAHRRIAAAANAVTGMTPLDASRRAGLDRIEEQGEGNNSAVSSGSGSGNLSTGSSGSGGFLRPLEDPFLVGEEAAARARRQRLARENGDEVLIREDRRWDWLLAQMNDWEERQASWRQFQRQAESGSRSRFGRLLGRRF